MATPNSPRAKPFSPLTILRFIWHLPNFVRLFMRLYGDARVSLFAKLVPVAAVAYVLSPLDFLPDYFPFFGQIDDVVLIVLSLRLFIALCPKAVVREHVAAIDAGR